MRLFLNAGFGNPLGVDLLQLLGQRGFAGVRQDIPTADEAGPLCRELAEAGLQPILLIAGGKMTAGPTSPALSPQEIAATAETVARVANDSGLFDSEYPAAIEIGNEPDIAVTYAKSPALFAEAVNESVRRIRTISDRAYVVSGGIASTDRRGLDYLAAAVQLGIPGECVVGYHTYRTTQPPEQPTIGFSSRDDEFSRLRELAGSRPIWCTESGWHTAPSTVRAGPFQLFSRRVQYTDAQVADFAGREVLLNAKHGALGLVWFQLNDGPNPQAYEDRFGIRTLDGHWKPVADALASLGPTIQA